jgi:hypothetical protein
MAGSRRSRRYIWLCVLSAGLLAAGCGSPAGRARQATAETAPAASRPAASRPAAGVWLSTLEMTSAKTGWALRWTANPSSAQAGYLVPARTTDAARTWTDVAPSAAIALLKSPDATVVLDALSASRAYLAVTAAMSQGASPLPARVFGTANGGRTWAESAPFRAAAPASLLSFANPDDGWLLASGGGAMGQDPAWLYRTTDAGMSWSPVAQATPSGAGGNGLPLGCEKTGLTFATVQVGWLARSCTGASQDVLLATRDGGTRWTPQPLPISTQCQSGCEVYNPPQFFGRAGFMVIGDGPGSPHFLASRDLGQTWVAEPLPSGAGWYPRLTFFGSLDGVLVSAGAQGTIGGTFDTTEDGGTTWTAIAQGQSFTATGTEFDFISPATGFAWVQGSDATSGPPAMDETTDSGHEWTSFTPVLARS